MYAKCFKRVFDALLSFSALLILSPVLLILMVVNAVALRGNPFFAQARPGRDEKIFRLLKFRTMDNRKDENGNLLPDHLRLHRFGKFLRASSLDELPELINILKGDMAIVGPRPLLVDYLPLYNDEQRHRHDVRPGLTGYAQVHGRNAITWEEKFRLDLIYIQNITWLGDLKIILRTVVMVCKHTGICTSTGEMMQPFTGETIQKETKT